MKKTKILLPAIGMLLLSTAASVSGTVAWFAANQTVSAQGMNVKAKAQAGLVIADKTTKTYNASATSSNSTVRELYPTSTSDCDNWVKANSSDPNAATTAGMTYTALSGDELTGQTYFAIHSYYIRSSAFEALTVASLDVTAVNITTGGSQELSKSVRVGVVYEDANYIYAPISGASTDYYYKSQDDVNKVRVQPKGASDISKNTEVTTIPGNTENGVEVTVYIWFEGEDAACKSANIITNLEQLTASVTFGYTAA